MAFVKEFIGALSLAGAIDKKQAKLIMGVCDIVDKLSAVLPPEELSETKTAIGHLVEKTKYEIKDINLNGKKYTAVLFEKAEAGKKQ